MNLHKVMGMVTIFHFALLTSLFLVFLIQAQDQSGFISIDCGGTANYTEATTGVNYISDASFISTGVIKSVTTDLKDKYQREMWNLRSFPDRIRNCYKINITRGSKYLIMVGFLYGNYDGLNSLPQFDLLLGANRWDTVNINYASTDQYNEIIHTPSQDTCTLTVKHNASVIFNASVGKNPNLCEPDQCNSTKKTKNIITPVAASVGGLLILLMAVAAIFWTFKKRKPKVGTTRREISMPYNREKDTLKSLQLKKQIFSYSDVIEITNNFNTIVGKGGFGTVYLGYIDDTPVAVKMLSVSSVQGYQQFQTEVKLLMRVHHRNLTPLIGYCNEGTNKGLIYEYMANGNLQEHLSGKYNKSKFLKWEHRLRIAVDAASGLEYLHNGCKPPIIHRDVKSPNILLTENLQAKISDFGLSKIVPFDGRTHVSTVVAGTPGYLDPDYSQSNRLTEKSDVYSFGVVLLELITSKPVISRNHEKTHISQWVKSMVDTGDIKGIVDSRLEGDFEVNSVWKAVETAMSCVSHNPNRRPTISEVVNELKECLTKELGRTKYGGANSGEPDEIVSMNVNAEFTPLAR